MQETGNRISFCVYKKEETDLRFEEGLSVFFGLVGSVCITCGNKEYVIQPAGIIVVNPGDLYHLRCIDTDAVICMRITQPFLRLAGWKDNLRYNCYIRSGSDQRPVYEHLRHLYAQVFADFFQDGGDESATVASTAMQFIALLQKHFSSTIKEEVAGEATIKRLQIILDYIHQHWNEKISLSEIARQNYLSTGYLSRFFQKYLHITFSQYVRELRLRHAAQWLTQRTESVTHIAYECGFGTPGVFIDAFHKYFGVTPRQYRQVQRKRTDKQYTAEDNNHSDDLAALIAYIREKRTDELPTQTNRFVVSRDIHCKVQTVWPRILNIGYARDGLMAPVQQQILLAQQEIGFTYLRFHGIFDEDMHIYSENEQGNPEFNFSYATLLFDFIVSTGLKPFVELGFMPRKLAREQTQIFDRPSIISGCIDLDKWTALVQETISFFLKRYGKEEVESWRFTTIGKSYAHIGCLTLEEHEELYCATWHAIKMIDPCCQFGGPSGFAHLICEPRGLPHFFQTALNQSCPPDFVSIQCHPHIQTGEDVLFMDYTLTQQFAPAILSSDDDFLLHAVQELQNLMEQHHISDREIYLEETNATLWQRDLSSDTSYKATWLAKNVCATQGQVVFGYWLLTDLLEERAKLESLFHGGYGLLTYNGIPKAGYQAMKLLSHLGNCVLDSGDNWMLTQKGQVYQLMLYNYCSYSNLYRYRYKRLEKPEDAYSVFETGTIQQLQFDLQFLPDGQYRTEYLSISRHSGSAFDTWVEIGAPQYPDKYALEYLRRRAEPGYRTEVLQAVNGLKLEVNLLPHEVVLVILQRDIES